MERCQEGVEEWPKRGTSRKLQRTPSGHEHPSNSGFHAFNQLHSGTPWGSSARWRHRRRQPRGTRCARRKSNGHRRPCSRHALRKRSACSSSLERSKATISFTADLCEACLCPLANETARATHMGWDGCLAWEHQQTLNVEPAESTDA